MRNMIQAYGNKTPIESTFKLYGLVLIDQTVLSGPIYEKNKFFYFSV